MKTIKFTYFLITLSVCICAISFSCTSNKSFEQSSNKIGKKLLEYRSEDYKARITNVMWRMPDIELTITIEVESDARSGEAFETVLEQTRTTAISACNAISLPNHAVPLINILVRDHNQLVYVERGGTAHFVVIALNLPTDKISFVNFSADWCDKGRDVDNAMKEVSESLGGSVHFETVDTDKEVELTSMANIVEVPSQMVFDKSGSFVDLYEGPMKKERITEILKPLMDI